MRRRIGIGGFTLLIPLLTLSLVLQPGSVNAQRTIKVGILDSYSGPPAVMAMMLLTASNLR